MMPEQANKLKKNAPVRFWYRRHCFVGIYLGRRKKDNDGFNYRIAFPCLKGNNHIGLLEFCVLAEDIEEAQLVG